MNSSKSRNRASEIRRMCHQEIQKYEKLNRNFLKYRDFTICFKLSTVAKSSPPRFVSKPRGLRATVRSRDSGHQSRRNTRYVPIPMRGGSNRAVEVVFFRHSGSANSRLELIFYIKEWCHRSDAIVTSFRLLPRRIPSVWLLLCQHCFD